MPTTTQPISRKQHLLLVDDERDVRGVFRKYFERHGYRVTTLASGLDALAFLNQEIVDLIVIDVVMIGMDGMQLLGRVRSEHPRLPAILFTGAGFDETMLADAREAGASGFVSKGLPMSQLLMEVHRLLDYQSPEKQ